MSATSASRTSVKRSADESSIDEPAQDVAPDFSTPFEVVTYNVLTPNYAGADHYHQCKPEDLASPPRFARVWEKLQPHVLKGSIICLQEVSVDWANQLQVKFVAHGYTLLTAHYGPVHSGNMGVAIAFPVARFELQKVTTRRVAKTKRWFPEYGPWQQKFRKQWDNVLWLFGRPRLPESTQGKASWRTNDMIVCNLLDRESGGAGVCVATYHMPCAFETPQVMVLHSALCLQETQRSAGALPYVLAGDFNFKPGDAAYNVAMGLPLNESDPAYPLLPAADTWKPTLQHAPQSAYKAFVGAEPEVTNYCVSGAGKTELFVGTLDYIFFNKLAVKDVLVLPTLDSLKATCPSFPTASEPSDHLKLAATFSLLPVTKTNAAS